MNWKLASGDMALSEIPEIQAYLTELEIERAIELWQTALDRYNV